MIPVLQKCRMTICLVFIALLTCTEAFANAKANSHYNRAMELENTGQTEAAIRELNETIKIDPEHRWAYYSLGGDWDKLNHSKEAWNAYHAGLTHFPNDSSMWWNVGNEYDKCGELDNAIMTFRTAAKKFPERKTFHRDIAEILCAQKKYDEGLREMLLSTVDRLDWTYWKILGDLYVGSGDKVNGVDAYQKGYNLFPQRTDNLKQRTDILRGIQRLREEIQQAAKSGSNHQKP